jgi:hypothetical protein
MYSQISQATKAPVVDKLKSLSLPPLTELIQVPTSETRISNDHYIPDFTIDDTPDPLNTEEKIDLASESEITRCILQWWVSQENRLNTIANRIQSFYQPNSIHYGFHLAMYVETQVYPHLQSQCPEIANHIIQIVRVNASYYIAFFLWKHFEVDIQEAYIECSYDKQKWLQLLDLNSQVWSDLYHPLVAENLRHLIDRQIKPSNYDVHKLVAYRAQPCRLEDPLLVHYDRTFLEDLPIDDTATNNVVELELLKRYLKIQAIGPLPHLSIPPQFNPTGVIQRLLRAYSLSNEIASLYQSTSSKDHIINLNRVRSGLCIGCGSPQQPVYCDHPSATISYFNAKIYFRCWLANQPQVLLDLSPKLTSEEQSLSKRLKEKELCQKLKTAATDRWNSYTEAKKYTHIPDYNLTPSMIDLKHQWHNIHCGDPTFSRQFLQESEFHISRPILAVHSGMNTGKTEQLIRYIKRLLLEGQISRFLYVSPRCSFANSVCQRLVEAGIPIQNYLDCGYKDNINDHNFVMISTESMYKAASRDRDLVIIDEVDTVLFQMLSPHHRDNLKTNQKVFETHIKEAKRLIILDANITSTALAFLQKLRPLDNIELIYNAYQPRRGWRAGVYKEAAWLSQIKDALATKENIVIVTSSEAYGETKILTMLIDKEKGCGLSREQIGWYHGSGDDLKDELKDVNSSWIKYRVVMYTSTINVGIDFNIPHFHSLFVYGSSQSVCIEEIQQMMGRIRSTKGNNNRIYCFIRDNRGQYIVDKAEIKAFIVRAHQLADEDASLDHFVTIGESDPVLQGTPHRNLLSVLKKATTVEVAYKHGFVLEDTCWNDLAVDYFLRINRSRAQYTERFLNMIEAQGIDLIDYRDEHPSQSEKQVACETSVLASYAREDRTDYFTRLSREADPTPQTRDNVETRIKNGEARSVDHDRSLVWRWKSRILPEYWDQIRGDMIDGHQRLTPQQLNRLQIIKSQDPRVGWHGYRRKAERSTIVGEHDELLLKANEAVCRLLEISSVTHYNQQELKAFRAERWDLKTIDPRNAQLGEIETQIEYLRLEQEGWSAISEPYPPCRRSLLRFDNRIIKDKIQDWTQAYVLLNASANMGLSAPKNLQSVTRLLKDWLSSIYGLQWMQTHTEPRLHGKRERIYTYLCKGNVFEVYNWLKPTNIRVETPTISSQLGKINLQHRYNPH